MKRIGLILLPVVGLIFAATLAQAQTWPSKPIRAVVPVAAGGATDIIPRVVLEQLSIQLGQPIVVENRPGAGTTIGANAVAKADADGYTILVNGPSHTIAPSLYPNLGYHPVQDFIAVAPFGTTRSALVVSPDRGWKTTADLIAAARAKPGSLNFASVGAGTATHLSAERFRASAAVEAVHVPFKGGAEAMTEVLAGRIDFFFGPLGLVLSNVREGKLVALAVNGTERSATLPSVPTLAETGLVNAEYPFWLGLFLPARTPHPVVERLHGETMKALQTAKVRDKLLGMGFDPMAMTPDAFGTYVKGQIESDAALVKATGLKAP
jgi:tripartite-type tricarboxylate transporter receptor subunit TctC